MGGPLLRGSSRRHIHLPHAIALPLPLAGALGVRGGGHGAALEGAGVRTVPVGAVVSDRDQMGALVDSPIVLAPLDYAQRLSGPGRSATRTCSWRCASDPGRTDSREQSCARRRATA